MPQFPPGQTLLIDADDTLWENNVYFERAIAAFISYLNHHEYSPAEVRQALNDVERETILTHGYGLPSFTHSLLLCFERLSPAPVTEEKSQRILSFARSIAEQEIELLPGVAETLDELASRHRLILMTKGNHAEQADKLTRSGLASYFSTVEIVAEKDPATYREVIRRYEITNLSNSHALKGHGFTGCGKRPLELQEASGHDFSRAVSATKQRFGFSPCGMLFGNFTRIQAFFRSLFCRAVKPADSARALAPEGMLSRSKELSDDSLRKPLTSATQSYWMIGNSPRSDINPALAAGLNAVFLFHKDTWVLEHATLDAAPAGQQLIELDSFAKLSAVF